MASAKRIQKAIETAILKAAFDMDAWAKKLCPVDTGLLRASIRTRIAGDKIIISASKEYASYVEFGTHKMHPQPFIRPALHMGMVKFLPNRLKSEIGKL